MIETRDAFFAANNVPVVVSKGKNAVRLVHPRLSSRQNIVQRHVLPAFQPNFLGSRPCQPFFQHGPFRVRWVFLPFHTNQGSFAVDFCHVRHVLAVFVAVVAVVVVSVSLPTVRHLQAAAKRTTNIPKRA